MAKEWKSGDLVKLKSGGPLMTVQGKNDVDGRYYVCTWFDENKPLKDSFHPDALEEGEKDENVSIDVTII